MLTYIRHVYNGKREASNTADVFVPIDVPHQDVVRYSRVQGDDVIVNTWGKQIFPDNYEISNSHERWKIIVLVKGELVCGKEELADGDFGIIPDSCTHTLRSKSDEVLFYWCTTNEEILINTLALCGYRGREIVKGHTDRIKQIAELFEKILYRFPSECDQRVFFMSAFTELFSYLSSTKDEDNTHVISEQLFRRCISHIEYCSGNVSVDYLAKRYFISRRYLYAMFKEYKNTSPIDYILSVRMKAADKFLITTDFNVAQIAELTGYSDYNHFTRAYKRYFGELPSKRRKLIRAQAGVPNTEEQKPSKGKKK